MSISKETPIIIVGSGVFGLSSALHLTEAGYSNISVFDRLDLLKLRYSFENGADTASADINKVFRASYAEKDYYHRLALRAETHFRKWDTEVRQLDPQSEQAAVFHDLKIFSHSGMVSLDDTDQLSVDQQNSLKDFEKSGLRHTQYVINDANDQDRAILNGWGHKLNPANVKQNPHLKQVNGVLDTTSGLLHASSAMIYVHTKLLALGVKFVTGINGEVVSIIDNGEGRVDGVVTKDGKSHRAGLTIFAAGPWTASLVPELEGLSEAQNGNVLLVKIPDTHPDLRAKYSVENFPIFIWRLGYRRERDKFAGFCAFPVSGSDGYLKIICRQKKYTNPVTLGSGQTVSVPVTGNSNPPESRLSKELVTQVKSFIKVFFPDLVQFGIHKTALLWYTDTINNEFIVDYIPNRQNALVVTGGSGHGFKFLPVLGEYVVDVIEGRSNTYTEVFKWRNPEKFEDINHIGDVKTGHSSYYSQVLAAKTDLQFSEDELRAPVSMA